MTRGLQLRHEHDSKRLGGLAAGVLIVALIITGRVQPGMARHPATAVGRTDATAAPYRIGDRAACPPSRPVLATADGRSYPPGHPTTPPAPVGPVACYPTAERATAAGYAPAPLPSGALEVGGVYLIPTSSRLLRQCRQAADRLGFAAPCPTLLPASSPHAAPPILCDPRFLCQPGVGFLFEEGGFVVPPGYVGIDGQPQGRLALAAAKEVTAFPVACLGGRRVATVEVRARRGSLFECPPGAGAHLGGVLLRWREGGVVMAVSMAGHRHLNRRLVLALAARMSLVLPSNQP